MTGKLFVSHKTTEICNVIGKGHFKKIDLCVWCCVSDVYENTE